LGGRRTDLPRRGAQWRRLGEEHIRARRSCRALAPEFRDQYARAREVQADTLFDECLEIADDASGDVIEQAGEDGAVISVANHTRVARDRLRVDARKWMVAKLAPKKYGDRPQIEHDVGDRLAKLMERFPPQVFRPASNDGS
jgi:hypothetical protein